MRPTPLEMMQSLLCSLGTLCRFATPAAAAVSNDQDKYRTSLEIGRYVFLVAVLIEFIILLVTIVLRVRHPYKESEGDFEEQRAARSAMAQIQMESLKNSTQRGNGKSPGPGQDSNFYTGSAKLYKR